jgi:hypothetical protein
VKNKEIGRKIARTLKRKIRIKVGWIIRKERMVEKKSLQGDDGHRKRIKEKL